MDWSASVLTGLTYDTEPTIVVTFNSAKYIFNVSENTNRAFLQSAQNWKRARAVFLTAVGTMRASGLPGMLMTLADASIGHMHVAGPYGLLHMLASMRSYALRDTLALNPIEVAESSASEPIYTDENVTVYAAPIHPSLEEVPSLGKRRRSSSPEPPAKQARGSKSPPGSTKPLLSIKHLMHLGGFPADTLHGERAQDWRREVIRRMFPGENAQTQKPKGKPKTAPVQGSSDKAVRVEVPVGFGQRLPRLKPLCSPDLLPSATTLAYVVVGPRLRGKFDVEKANALGIPSGQIRGKLVRGETITFTVDDGKGGRTERVVRPQDCISKSEGRGVFVVLDVPTPSHISSVIAAFEGRDSLSQFCYPTQDSERESEYVARTVFHLCGGSVLEDSRYKTFMNGFGPEVYHVVASRDYNTNPVTFTSAAFNTLRLNTLDPELFPLPKFSLSAKRDLATIESLPANILSMESNVTTKFYPFKPPARLESLASSDFFHPAVKSSKSISLSTTTLECFAKAKIHAQEAHKHPLSNASAAGDKVMVIPLGTGSAMPTKYRNVSGTLIQIPGRGNVLLEAGEGTWGQLVRHFGLDDMPHVLGALKCVFISHIHGDHHIGLAKILSMRRRLLPNPKEPLFLITHNTVLSYLYEYGELEDLGLDNPGGNGVVPILSDVLRSKGARVWQGSCSGDNTIETQVSLDVDSSHKATAALCKSLGLERITTVDVAHRTKCFGVVLRHTDGWSIVFSGDTMPSERLVQEGENTTLLIHEATMADEQASMAHAKAHSTFGQAMQVAKSMKAKNVLLTHFSARYPKMPPSVLTPPDAWREPTLGLAFDQARVEIGNMRRLCLYLPAIEQSFLDTKETEDDDRDDGSARIREPDIV